jgi:bifunctional non-homologous end joining protein LigD
MALEQYRRKRQFKSTPEPSGRVRAAARGHIYVMQKHAATRLHYDFRLELGGVLKSWAVPKGPSLDPREKRLAAHVEDHPVEYAAFEGIIPKGQYGGGTVMVWDRGTWEPLGSAEEMYATGKMKFRLAGEKLRGAWALVRMSGPRHEGGKEWLLIKERDDEVRSQGEYDVTVAEPDSVISRRSLEEITAAGDAVWNSGRPARVRKATPRGRSAGSAARVVKRISVTPSDLPGARRAKPPATFLPQLATLAAEVPAGAEWIHEIKYDGYRMLCHLRDGAARLVSRRGLDWTPRFAPVAAAAAQLPLDETVLDGEVVILRPDGTTDFQALQNALKGGRRLNLVYYVFDVPYCQGYDLTRTPLLERKRLLARLLARQPERGVLRYSGHIQGHGPQVLRGACQMGAEGVVSKRADSTYEPRRARTWLKIKCKRRQEFVICGYTNPQGRRSGFGALVLGYYERSKLVCCGRVGTGFSDQTLRRLYQELKPRERKTPPVANPPRRAEARDVHWVKPELVAEVEFGEWTSDGSLRHPSFRGLRPDKVPREVVREKPVRPE